MLPLALDSQVRAPEYSQICKRRWGYKDPKVCPSEDAAAEEGGRRQDHRQGAEEAVRTSQQGQSASLLVRNHKVSLKNR